MSEDTLLPSKWLFLDLVGGLVLAIGLVLLIGEPREFLPWDIDYADMGMGLIIVGVMFMLPMLFHMVTVFRKAANRRGPASG